MSDYFEKRDKQRREYAKRCGSRATGPCLIAEAGSALADALDECSDPADIARAVAELRDFVITGYHGDAIWVSQAVQLGLTLAKLDREKLSAVVNFCVEFQDEDIRWSHYDAEDRRRCMVPLLRRYLHQSTRAKRGPRRS